jgi:predicted N-acyltransferase
MSVRIARSIGEIDRAEWAQVFPPTPEGYDFYRAIEQTLSQQFKLFYILVYKGPTLQCLAPCFIMEYALDTTISGPLKHFLSLVRCVVPRLLTVRAVICGSPTSDGKIGIRDLGSREILMEAIAGEMRAVALKENIRMLAFKDFWGRDAYLMKPLARLGFHRIRSFPFVKLDIRFESFENYLRSLSRATRKDLKRKFKKVNGKVHIEMEVRSEVGDLLDEVYALYLQTLKKSDVIFETIPKEFFREVPRNIPEYAKFFLWRLDGRLVAFVFCLVTERALLDKYIGMDYGVAYKYHLYFITFRDILRWCIAHGIRRYESPQLGYDPKKRLDFTFIPDFVYVRHVNRVLNFFIGLACTLLKPENFDPVLRRMIKKVMGTGRS